MVLQLSCGRLELVDFGFEHDNLTQQNLGNEIRFNRRFEFGDQAIG